MKRGQDKKAVKGDRRRNAGCQKDREGAGGQTGRGRDRPPSGGGGGNGDGIERMLRKIKEV